MRKFFLLAVVCFALFYGEAQVIAGIPPVTGSINAAGSSCSSLIMDSTNSGPSNCVSMQLPGQATTASIVLAGTFSATVQFETSADSGRTWIAASVASSTSAGTFTFSVAGFNGVRARASAYTSGTVLITINIGTGGGPIAAGGLGQNAVYNGTGSIGSSPSSLDVSIFESVGVGDACARINAAETAASTGILLDARAFQGTQACALNFLPSGSLSDVLFANILLQVHQTICVPGKINIYGIGWDNNPSTGAGATTFQATSDLALGGAHPGPIVAWGNPLRNCWTGPVIQNSMFRNITFDCNNVATAGVQGFNNNEDAGLDDFKLVNCGGGGTSPSMPSLEAAGPAQNANLASCSITSGTNALTCTAAAFDVSMMNAQFILATATTNCIAGNPCIITGITSTTAATISASPNAQTNYTGTTVTNQALTWTNANAQNGYYMHGNIGLTTLAGACPASGNPPGPLFFMNTGSGSNSGPRFAQDFTFVTNCASGQPPQWIVDISGANFQGRDWHLEAGALAGNLGGIIIGKNAVSSNVHVNGAWASNMGNAAGNTVAQISNAFASSNVGFHAIKMVGNSNATNLFFDQITNCTIPITGGEAVLGDYFLGTNNRIIASSSVCPSSTQSYFTGIGVGGTLTANTTYSVFGLGGSSLTFNANTTSAESIPIPSQGVLTGLNVACGTGPAAGHTDVWTVQVNGVASSLTCSTTGAGAQTCSDSSQVNPSHAKTVAAGNLLKVTVLTDATSTTSADCRVVVTKE